jgi:Flagellar biosynthesis protein, FliO
MELIAQYSTQIIYALAILAALLITLIVWRGLQQRVRGRRGQRLGISEYQELDQSRRLVLVRRDNVEHLILIGGPTDVVVESRIGVQVQPSYSNVAEDDEVAARPVVLRPTPRPAVFGDRKPPPLRSVERADPPLAGSRVRDPDEP